MFFVKNYLRLILIGLALITTLGWTYYIFCLNPFYFPKNTGPFAVGMRELHWIDKNRLETRVQDPEHPNRELMVKVWYPAQGQKTTYSRYAPELRNFLKQNFSFKDKIKDLLSGGSRPIYSNHINGPAAPIQQQESFPVLIFSHGYGMPSCSYTNICSEMASHGFVVFAINHTYDCMFVKFNEHRTVKSLPPKELTIPNLEPKKIYEVFRNIIQIWSDDVDFVLNELQTLTDKKNDKFSLNLDLDKIGIFGHSLGGATTVNVYSVDERIKAAVCLDAGLFKPITLPKNFTKQMLVIQRENASELMCKHLLTLPAKIQNKELKTFISSYFSFFDEIATKIISLGGASQHLTFCDYAILKQACPLRKLFDKLGLDYFNLEAGINDGFALTKLINSHVLNFFKHNLQNHK